MCEEIHDCIIQFPLLLYSVQAWELSAAEIQKIDGFLRKMIAGGYARKNVPALSQRKKGIDPASQVEGELDWAYKISNARLHTITNTQAIQDFCHIQHLSYIAHVCRMENNSIQKQVLFDKRRSWKKVENLLGIDRQQALRGMMNKKDFLRLLERRFPRPKQSPPKAIHAPSGKN